MTSNESIELFLETKEKLVPEQVNEKAAIELSDVISGSFVYVLVDRARQLNLDTEVIAGHLEDLYDGGGLSRLHLFRDASRRGDRHGICPERSTS